MYSDGRSACAASENSSMATNLRNVSTSMFCQTSGASEKNGLGNELNTNVSQKSSLRELCPANAAVVDKGVIFKHSVLPTCVACSWKIVAR